MRTAFGWLLRGGLLGGLAFMIFGPLANLVLWAVAIQWYFPHKLPLTWGFKYWGEVFKPTSDTLAALGTSVLIASITSSSVFSSPSRRGSRWAERVCRVAG